MTSMNSFSINDVILIRYPFTDLKVRPAIVVSTFADSGDIIIVPLTSKTDALLDGEFILKHWEKSGLNIESTVKRGIITIDSQLVLKTIGTLHYSDITALNKSIKLWLNISG